jgi:Zn-dependent protease with chaperone function
MLTRDKLTDAEWRAVRNTPHHVIVAVSASGGSTFDDMLERHAGLKSVLDAMYSTHPLLREIATSAEIMAAQDEIRKWYVELPEADRTSAMLQDKALESMQQAMAALTARGGPDDRLLYADFVVAAATRVARAAKEGDLLGIDGVRVSGAEQDFIARLSQVAQLRSG